jgi:hypothetical protein
VFPDDCHDLTATSIAGRELRTIAQVAAGLDDNYTLCHGVHWTHVERGSYAIFGEIGFAIVVPAGKIL